MSNLLTVKEVSRRLRVSPEKLRRWRVQGEGPRYVRIGHRSLRYPEAEVEKFIQDKLEDAV
jgi:excisionase family DNA binding protein